MGVLLRDVLLPRLPVRQVFWMLGFAVVGGLIAGIYGVLHDLVTCQISPEYFSHFKRYQFGIDEAGEVSVRWLAVRIGFQASWAVGFFAAWFMGRVTVPKLGPGAAAGVSLRGVGLMLVVTLMGGCCGWLWARVQMDESWVAEWAAAFRAFHLEGVADFATVGCIHNGSYLGALAGLLLALWYCRREVRRGALA